MHFFSETSRDLTIETNGLKNSISFSLSSETRAFIEVETNSSHATKDIMNFHKKMKGCM